MDISNFQIPTDIGTLVGLLLSAGLFIIKLTGIMLVALIGTNLANRLLQSISKTSFEPFKITIKFDLDALIKDFTNKKIAKEDKEYFDSIKNGLEPDFFFLSEYGMHITVLSSEIAYIELGGNRKPYFASYPDIFANGIKLFFVGGVIGISILPEKSNPRLLVWRSASFLDFFWEFGDDKGLNYKIKKEVTVLGEMPISHLKRFNGTWNKVLGINSILEPFQPWDFVKYPPTKTKYINISVGELKNDYKIS